LPIPPPNDDNGDPPPADDPPPTDDNGDIIFPINEPPLEPCDAPDPGVVPFIVAEAGWTCGNVLPLSPGVIV
jgi:hypothetical protein